MSESSDAREPWDRLALELRADRQAQRQAWGDVDDVQIARYLAGDCSAQECAEVEQAMRDFPDVREVIDVLRGVLPARRADAGVVPRDRVVEGQPAGTGRALPRRMPWRAALVGLGLAASFLLGWLAGGGKLGPQPSRPGERLLASLTAVPRDARSVEAARVTLDDRGVYRIAGGKDFALDICSPRRGMATLVLLGPDHRLVYPLPGQADIAVEALEPRKFGPLDRPEMKTTVLVIVTATPVAETVRRHLAEAGGAQDQLEQALWAAGQRWAALGRIIIEPAGRP
jgi:hypothetical protein